MQQERLAGKTSSIIGDLVLTELAGRGAVNASHIKDLRL